VLEEKTVAGMNGMLSQIPLRGTATRARLDGIPTAGKTGTTNAYRDAWFDGFTGNYVASLWFGNDGYAPMRRMTGGTLPAMTWKRFMAYAHSGIELKPIPYVDDPKSAPTGAPLVAEGAAPPTDRPLSLSVRTSEQLAELEKLLRSVPGVRGMPTAGLGRSASIISIGAPSGKDDALPER
jgi:penicillin-binding protein 1A